MAYSSGTKIVRPTDLEIVKILEFLAKQNFKATICSIANSLRFKTHLFDSVASTISKEALGLASTKNPSLISKKSCEDILNLTNKAIVEEVAEKAPLLFTALQHCALSNRRYSKIKRGLSTDTTEAGLSMAFSVLMKTRSSQMSAMAYRNSFTLHFSGAKKRVSTITFKVIQMTLFGN